MDITGGPFARPMTGQGSTSILTHDGIREIGLLIRVCMARVLVKTGGIVRPGRHDWGLARRVPAYGVRYIAGIRHSSLT